MNKKTVMLLSIPISIGAAAYFVYNNLKDIDLKLDNMFDFDEENDFEEAI